MIHQQSVKHTLHASAFIVALVTVITFGLATPAYAKKVGDATIPDSIDIAGTEVSVRGAGLRRRSFFHALRGGFIH